MHRGIAMPIACAKKDSVSKEPLIAVIDDDDSLRAALTEALQSLGYDAVGFGSAEEFFAAGQTPLPDCIIADIHLPGMSGLELMRHLGLLGSQVPVVMMTARVELQLQARAIASGAASLLRKPFETGSLVACMRDALKRV
jgi:FixJ family two-component response regulator